MACVDMLERADQDFVLSLAANAKIIDQRYGVVVCCNNLA